MRFFDAEQHEIMAFRDDREVGRPGRVLMELLEKHDLKEHAIVISRIFGGVKLGVGSVSRAFREAGENVIAHYISP